MNKQDQSTKQKIIDAAFELFSTNGIKNTSMREVAAACGVTKPVIYYYFEDKDNLCLALVEHMKALQCARLQDLADAKEAFPVFLQKLFAAQQSSADNKRTIGFMVHLYSYMSARPAFERKIKQTQKDEPLEAINRVLAQQVKAGNIPADKQNIALHLILANSTHIVLNTQNGRLPIPKTYPADISRAILRALCYTGDK